MFRTRTAPALIATALMLPSALVAQDLPKGEAVMERFIEAMGGRVALAAKRSTVMKGTMEIAPVGLKGALTVYQAEPNLILTEVDFAGIGKIREGFDGKVAWSFSAMQGPQIKAGEEKDTTEQSAHFHAENWKDQYKQVQTLGMETVDDEPCYKVLATPHKGQPSTRFFSVKTGLLLKALVKVKTAMGEVAVESTTKDYKNVGGILVPHRMIQSVSGQVITLTFQGIEWNTPIPQNQFDLPGEIKALMNAPKPMAAKK